MGSTPYIRWGDLFASFFCQRIINHEKIKTEKETSCVIRTFYGHSILFLPIVLLLIHLCSSQKVWFFFMTILWSFETKWSLGPEWLIAAGAYPNFFSMKKLGVFLLPLDRMLVHRRSLPHSLLCFPNNSLVPIYIPGWREVLPPKFIAGTCVNAPKMVV